MRVLIVSWEYPPLVVGGLGRHVEALARELTGLGHDVRVLTRGSHPAASTEVIADVTVIRAAADPLALDFTAESVLAWAQAFEHSLIRAGIAAVQQWQPDVIHAHDWLVGQTAHTLHQLTGAPVVATIHATEYGRQQGWLAAPVHTAIHSIERWLCAEAATVLTCSTFMAEEVGHLFQLDRSRIRVIGNGIDPANWLTPRAPTSKPDSPVIAFAGRLVHEKGLQELIKAIALLREGFPGIRLEVAGIGPQRADQQDRARRYGVDTLIRWHGQLEDAALARLFATADVVVVPSLYEPFGLVALEAQAAGTPVAAADTGGLRDLVEPGITGERFAIESPRAIADAVRRLLSDPERTAEMAAHAQRLALQNGSWTFVARQVTEAYTAVTRSHQDVHTPVASTD